MFIIAYIIEGFATVLGMALMIMYWLILIRALSSWFSPDPYNPIVQFLHRATNPVLEPLRYMLMPLTMRIRIDLSPLLAFFLIVFFQERLVRVLFNIADMFK